MNGMKEKFTNIGVQERIPSLPDIEAVAVPCRCLCLEANCTIRSSK